ncbi:MAG: hypothetical protein LBQ31_01330 [Bacteroidales bacterium]|nr:hypothetical protein [Bacteroidales bacterium]
MDKAVGRVRDCSENPFCSGGLQGAGKKIVAESPTPHEALRGRGNAII